MTNAQPVDPESLTLDVLVKRAAILEEQPQRTLAEHVEKYANEVFAKAEEYEAVHRRNITDVRQFTSAHIADADAELRRKYGSPPKPRSKWHMVGKLGIYLAAGGIAVGGKALNKPWGAALFFASLIAGLFLIGITEYTDHFGRKSD